MTELITVMVIVGIMAAIVAPRFFDRATFDSRGFYDQIISTIRYAQKAAIAQHRLVCVAFSATTITLTIDSDIPTDGACNAAPAGNLTSPEGDTPYVVTAPAGLTLAGYADFNFNALGRPSFATAPSITVSGYATAIRIEAETGYVH